MINNVECYCSKGTDNLHEILEKAFKAAKVAREASMEESKEQSMRRK